MIKNILKRDLYLIFGMLVFLLGILVVTYLPISGSYAEIDTVNKIFYSANKNMDDSVIATINNLYGESENDYLYLSDIPYKEGKTAWGKITYDKTSDGGALTLKLNGSAVTFKKGIWAHATSTIVYDISQYNYDYFTAYLGINTTSSAGNGVKYYIYTSTDNKNWTLKTSENPAVTMPGANATFVKVDIRDANYLKLYVDHNGANGNDHSVYGDAKLIKEGYNDNVTMSVSEYDELIRTKYDSNPVIDTDLEKLLLQRTLVDRVGQYQLKQIYEDDKTRLAFNTLFNDIDMLRLYIMGGTPDGTYQKSFEVLSDLLKDYKNDLTLEGLTESGIPLKNVYKKMMITLSLTHSKAITFWINSSAIDPVDVNPNVSLATRRYQIYKDMLAKEKLHPFFEQLEVEEMRLVMNSMINDDEIEWLRDYIVGSGKNWRSAYQFMSYKNVNTALYRSDQFYGENRNDWNAKYKLDGYDIANVRYYPKTFMIMQIGGVCWQISNIGQTMTASYGVPSVAVGQPGHVAYLVYDRDAKGNSTWSIWNNVYGWQQSNLSNYTGNKGYYKVRLLNGWGNQSFASGNSGSYMLLAQAALDHYEEYVKAEEKAMLADSYASSGDKENADKIYREALEIQPYNLDVLHKLVMLHVNEKNGLFGEYNQDLYSVAEVVASKLKYYPLPMYDLFRIINGSMTDTSYKGILALLQNRTLTDATKANNNNVLQSDVCRTMANYLLGSLNFELATFKFDGDAGATLTLSNMFNGANPYWDYSVDGGNTWISVDNGISVVLPDDIVNQITVNNDIKVHLIGVDYSEDNIYTIDILQASKPTGIYNNDLENKVIGATDVMEWRLNENDSWTSFANLLPNLKGDISVDVRTAANGVYLPSDVVNLTYTEDVIDITKNYISIDRLSIFGYSSQTDRPGNREYATNAIDGNLYTMWHTDRTSGNDERYIIIKVNEPTYLSRLQLVPTPNYNYGLIKNAVISISIDGENWTEVKTITDLPKSYDPQNFDFDSVKAQYIKLQVTKSYDYLMSANADYFVNAAMINLFEDSTRIIPTAEVMYDIADPTAKVVTATLVNPNVPITVTNNSNSMSHQFKDNGSFTFIFESEDGEVGAVTATVDWITDYEFNFSGSDANKLIISSKYYQAGFSYEYSLDGGNTWITKDSLEYTFSNDEILSMNANDDIKIHIISSKLGDDINFDIDLLAPTDLPNTIFSNDLENKVIGVTDDMEWKIVGTDTWTSYKEGVPNLSGDVSVEVRYSGDGKILPSSSQVFTFTDDNLDEEHEYIPITDVSIHSYSTDSASRGEGVDNLLDGNLNTMWHTDHAVIDTERYVVLELKNPSYVSRVQYVPKANYTWGVMKNANVYTSLDGINWTLAAEVLNSPMDNTPKNIDLNESTYAKYVKFQVTKSYDYLAGNDINGVPYDYFAHATMINLFKDSTLEEETVVYIEYDITDATNQDVTAKIISMNSDITIDNNDHSDTYVFTDNGEFIFEYTDEKGICGSIKAEVSWIDKVKPEATLSYDITEETYNPVTVTISSDEVITIINNDGNNTYTFEDNGEFTFEFSDSVGNVNTITAKVDWINLNIPNLEVIYDITKPTNRDVTAILVVQDGITIINNEGSNTYTFTENGEFVFKYVDRRGNIGSSVAKVTWINTVAPNLNVSYSTTDKTNQNVIATLNVTGGITITNNDGNNTYTFIENGEFTFEYVDVHGNVGSTTAKVTWIDKTPVLNVTYDITDYTNQNVTATLELQDGITVTNNGGSNTYIFTENGDFVFEYVDQKGHVGTTRAVVTWIDKIELIGEIKYSNTITTSGEVIAKLITNKDVTILNNNGSDKYTFTENGEFTFEFKDKVGTVKTLTATVTWINSEAPSGNILYSTTEYTNQDVTATLEVEEGITITNNGGLNTYTFTESGVFVFEIVDQDGNVGSVVAIVDWLDKKLAEAYIEYSTTDATKDNVIATIKSNENVKIINNDGNDSYTFTANGDFTFQYEDKYGNRGILIARVTWIHKNEVNVEVDYDIIIPTDRYVVATLISDKDIIILNNNGSNIYVFTENGEFVFKYMDSYGIVYEVTAKVTWINKQEEENKEDDIDINVPVIDLPPTVDELPEIDNSKPVYSISNKPKDEEKNESVVDIIKKPENTEEDIKEEVTEESGKKDLFVIKELLLFTLVLLSGGLLLLGIRSIRNDMNKS